MIDLNSTEMQIADIIIVGPRTLKSHLNVLGQKIIRRAGGRSQKELVSDRSHVMLAIGSGAIIHADGETICTASLRDYLTLHQLTVQHVRVVRRIGLTNEEAERICAEAHRFMDQGYSFIHGRLTTRMGKIRVAVARLFRQRSTRNHTMPFCSELVAQAYQAVGINVTPCPTDQTLPLDIELACSDTEWADVTADYFKSPWTSTESTSPEIQALRETLRASHISAMAAMERTAAINSQQLAHFLKAHYAAFEAFTAAAPLLVINAHKYISSPELLLQGSRELVLNDLSNISEFYSRVMGAGAAPDEASIFGMLKEAYPNAPPQFVVYEGMPTLESIQAEEKIFNLRILFALSHRLWITLDAMVKAISVLIDSDKAGAVDLATSLEWISKLPALPTAPIEQLLERAREIDKSTYPNWDIEAATTRVFLGQKLCISFVESMRQSPGISNALDAADFTTAALWIESGALLAKQRKASTMAS